MIVQTLCEACQNKRPVLGVNEVGLTIISVAEGIRPTSTGIGYEVSEVGFTAYLDISCGCAGPHNGSSLSSAIIVLLLLFVCWWSLCQLHPHT
jgi:hypothetical protein